ncbi:MAG: hypothetical protein ABSE82_15795, partial [Nitrososphaerales archaeon]
VPMALRAFTGVSARINQFSSDFHVRNAFNAQCARIAQSLKRVRELFNFKNNQSSLFYQNSANAKKRPNTRKSTQNALASREPYLNLSAELGFANLDMPV